VDSIDRIIDIYEDSMINSVKNYINDYSTILKREIMGNDKLTKLSNRIYENHKEILDFIYDRKPDQYDDINIFLMDVIKDNGFLNGSESKRYVRFTTEKIKELTYYNKTVKNGWRYGETFLFEFVLYPDTNKINFKTVISPSDLDYNTERLSELLLQVEGSKKPRGKKWIVHHVSSYKFDFDSINEDTEEGIIMKLDKVVKKVVPVIEKYENKFLEHSDELLKLKNCKS